MLWWRAAGRAVVALAVGVALTGCSSNAAAPAAASSTGTPSPSATISTPVPLPVASARALESAARSGDEASIRRAFVVPSGTALDPQLADGLAAFARFDIDQSQFVQTSDTTATVPVTTVDAAGVTRRWTAILQLIDGGWLIAATQEQK